jgi:hypothetical protein
MTRMIALLLVLTLAGGLLAACGKKNDPEAPSGPNTGFGRPYPRS